MNPHVRSIGASALILIATVTPFNLVPAQGSVELIINGGFESGDLSSWSGPIPNPNPWSPSGILVHTGNYSAYNPALGTAVGATTLSQSFSPTPLSGISAAGFWYYHPAGAPGTVGLATELFFSDGTVAQDTLYADDPRYQINVWTYCDLRPAFSAYPNKELTGIGFFPKAFGIQYVDDVSIVGIPVPEPGTAIVACLGMILAYCRLGHRFPWRVFRYPQNCLTK